MKFLDNFFESNIVTGILFGLSAFLSILYLLSVNPTILAEKGIEIGSLGFAWQEALGILFWAGLLIIIGSLLKVREHITNAIPRKIRPGVTAVIGVFLMLVALNISGILIYKGINIQGIGLLISPSAIVFYVGIIVAFLLNRFGFKVSLLFSVVIAAIVAHLLDIGTVIKTIQISKQMLPGTFAFDIGIIIDPRSWSIILVFFLLDFYGRVINFTKNKTKVGKDSGDDIVTEEKSKDLIIIAVSTLTFLLLLLITPLINFIPVVATTGALFFIVIKILPKKEEFIDYKWFDTVVFGAMIFTIIATFELNKALLVGFGLHIILQIIRGEFRNVNLYLLSLITLLLLSVLLI